MTTPGTTLLNQITDAMSQRWEPPAKVWDSLVSASDNSDYAYLEAAEAFDNLSAEQMAIAEGFVHRKRGQGFAIANLARAAYDAGAYPNSGFLLTNLVAMYDDLKKFDVSCPYDEFLHPHLNIYRVVAAIKADISELPVEQQRGLIAAAQFTLSHFLSTSVDYDLIDLTRSPKDNLPNEAIWLQDSALRGFLNRNPSKVRDALNIKEEHPKISATSLVAVLEGESAPSLASGCL